MKKSILLLALASLTASVPAAFAGIFDSIDSVGVIQSKDGRPADRGPAGKASDTATADNSDDEFYSEPAPTRNAPAPAAKKNKKTQTRGVAQEHAPKTGASGHGPKPD